MAKESISGTVFVCFLMWIERKMWSVLKNCFQRISNLGIRLDLTLQCSVTSVTMERASGIVWWGVEIAVHSSWSGLDFQNPHRCGRGETDSIKLSSALYMNLVLYVLPPKSYTHNKLKEKKKKFKKMKKGKAVKIKWDKI